jgi:hypothetical protein
MAGRKITQLPTLTTPAATDKLVIVDVSDTSESPQGTSKQIALSNLGISDVFTPTISNITADATVSISDCFYVELGKWANMSFVLDVQMDAAASNTTFDVSLPFTTSGISVLTFGNQSVVVDSILSTATGASVSLNVQSLNAGDTIDKLECSINFLLA